MSDPWTALLTGKRIQVDGVEVTPRKGTLNFVTGAGISLSGSYNASQQRTEVTVQTVGASAGDWKDSARAATTAPLPTNTRSTNTLTASSNGALPSQDGVALSVGDRLLVQDEVTAANNGVYTIDDLGSAGTPWAMTRASDFDASSEVTAGVRIPIEEGTTYGGAVIKLDTVGTITLNSTALAFSSESLNTWASALANGDVTGTNSPKLSSSQAYDTDTGVDLTLRRAGTTVAVANGTSWDFQNDYLTTTDHYRVGATPAASGTWFRVGNALGARSRNAGNSADISMLVCSAGDVVQLGDSTNAPSVQTLATTSIFENIGGTNVMAYRATSVTITSGVELRWDTSSGDRVINTNANEDLVAERNGVEHTRFASGYLDTHTNYHRMDGISKPATPASTEIHTYCSTGATSKFSYVDDAGTTITP